MADVQAGQYSAEAVRAEVARARARARARRLSVCRSPLTGARVTPQGKKHAKTVVKYCRERHRPYMREVVSYIDHLAENGRPAPVSLFEPNPDCPVEVCYLRDARRGESLSLFGKSKGASKFGQSEFSSFMRTALITEREFPERTLYKLGHVEVQVILNTPVRDVDWAQVVETLARVRYETERACSPDASLCRFVHGT